MSTRFLAGVPALLILFHFSPELNAAPEENGRGAAVVRLGENVVTRGELEDRFQVAVRLLARQQGVSLAEQDSATIERLRQQYLDKFAAQLVLLREADRRNVTASESDVKSAVADIVATTEDDGDILEDLSDLGIDGKKQLRELVQDEKTIELVTEHLLQEIVIPAGDVITFHHDMKDQLATPEQVCVRHIQSDTVEAAKLILRELDSGADFSQLAMGRSTDEASASSGGDLGCFEKGGLGAKTEFEKAVFSATEGELVGPVASEFGYHVINVYEHKAPHVPTLNEAYFQIARELAIEELPQRIKVLVERSGVQTYPENWHESGPGER